VTPPLPSGCCRTDNRRYDRTSDAPAFSPDPAGAVTGLVLLVVGAGLVENPDLVPVPAVLVLAAGAMLLGGFVLTQRYGRDPLLDWSALTHRRFLRANGVAFINTATTSASGPLVAFVGALGSSV